MIKATSVVLAENLDVDVKKGNVMGVTYDKTRSIMEKMTTGWVRYAYKGRFMLE